jgi:FdhD protein
MEILLEETMAVVEETEVSLSAGERLIERFHCTPEALRELAAGHLFCRGLISAAEEITHIEIQQKSVEEYTLEVTLATGGTSRTVPVHPVPLPPISRLRALTRTFFDCAEKYKRHGGIHCSALYDGMRFVAQFEDVGRHNAFDKVVGRALMDGLAPSGLIYFTSGRVNSEIATKAGICGFPLIVSRSIATTRACRIAREQNIAVIGRIETEKPLLFNAAGSYA